MFTTVQPPMQFLPPALDPNVLAFVQTGLPLWLRWQKGIHPVTWQNGETLAEFYQQFQSGRIRLLLAFRHPSTDEPPCLIHLLANELPKVARGKGIRLQGRPHAHFIYDRGIPLWAGGIAEWLLPKLGATPILRGKLDRQGLRSARDLFANGQFPLAAAPEGGANGHSEIINQLEPGIAQLGFWCVEDLRKASRPEKVVIVPIGVRYTYHQDPWPKVAQLLAQLESDCGLKPDSIQMDPGQPLTKLYPRLYRLGTHLLDQMEEFYLKYYPVPGQIPDPVVDAPNLETDAIPGTEFPFSANLAMQSRLHKLLNIALRVAEQNLDLQPKGSLIDRRHRIEQAGWDRIFREDIQDPTQLPPVALGLANRIAQEAYLHLWHMRLVETFISVTGRYVREKPTVERFAETLLRLWDVITRMKGGNPLASRPPDLGSRRAVFTVGDPVVVSDRWEQYDQSRKQAVTDLTQDLYQALETLILNS